MPDTYSGQEPTTTNAKAFLETCYGRKEIVDAVYSEGPAAVHAFVLRLIDKADQLYKV